MTSSFRARQVHDATAAVRVRAFVEAYTRTVGRAIVTTAVAVDVPGGDYATAPLYLDDLAALLGDPVPTDPAMSRQPADEGVDPARRADEDAREEAAAAEVWGTGGEPREW